MTAPTAEHGTFAMYQRGCRCEPCRAKQGAYRRRRRAKLAEERKARPFTDEWKPCVVCGGRVRRKTGEERNQFDKRKVCSRGCTDILAHRWLDSDLRIIGSRTVLAMTCRSCGGLLPGASFHRDQRDGHISRTCMACASARALASMSESKLDEYRTNNRNLMRRLQASTVERATRGGYQWTGPELEIASRDDLSISQIAALLGRTYTAVAKARSAVRGDPRKAKLAGLSHAKAS